MKLWQFLSVILILSISPLEISGQNNSGIVSGSVFNSGQEPLVGVSVFVKGTNIGTMTDADGRFSVKAEDGQSLEFRYIGYDTKVVTVNGKTMSVTMSENQVILDDVVVIGYGTQKKSDLTGSLSSVKGEDIVKTGDTNITQSLQGKAPGVYVTSNSGTPGAGATIRIRGYGSISTDLTPLYVVDGQPMEESSVNTINPIDIENIEVLKDAASAAIYGSRAAGGVILITTKSGRKDTPTKLDINLFTGISHNPKKLNVFNGEEYSRFARYYKLAGDGFGAETGAVPFVGEGTDWQDVMLNTAMTYKANATISGGSKTGAYSASISYLNKEGILRNTDHESYNIRLKSDYSFLNNRLTIGQSMIVRLAQGKGNIDQDTMFGILQFPSVVPVYDPTNATGWGTSANINLPNPLGYSNVIDNTNESTRIFLNAYLQAEIIKDLKYKFNVGIRKDHTKSRTYTGIYDLGTFGKNDAPDLKEGSSTYDSWVIENTLNYDKVFGKHNISLLAGYSAQKDKHYGLNGSNSDIPQFIETMTGNTTTMSASSNLKELALGSLFGRVMYSLDARY